MSQDEIIEMHKELVDIFFTSSQTIEKIIFASAKLLNNAEGKNINISIKHYFLFFILIEYMSFKTQNNQFCLEKILFRSDYIGYKFMINAFDKYKEDKNVFASINNQIPIKIVDDNVVANIDAIYSHDFLSLADKEVIDNAIKILFELKTENVLLSFLKEQSEVIRTAYQKKEENIEIEKIN